MSNLSFWPHLTRRYPPAIIGDILTNQKIMGMESPDTNTTPQEENIPEWKRVEKMVLDVAEKSREITESILLSDQGLEKLSQNYLSMMKNGDISGAIDSARRMTVQAELTSDLLDRRTRENAAQRNMQFEHKDALSQFRDVIPSEKVIDDLLTRYTDPYLSPYRSDPVIDKLSELREVVRPYWQAYKDKEN
jgi:hypothetical protein